MKLLSDINLAKPIKLNQQTNLVQPKYQKINMVNNLK